MSFLDWYKSWHTDTATISITKEPMKEKTKSNVPYDYDAMVMRCYDSVAKKWRDKYTLGKF